MGFKTCIPSVALRQTVWWDWDLADIEKVLHTLITLPPVEKKKKSCNKSLYNYSLPFTIIGSCHVVQRSSEWESEISQPTAEFTNRGVCDVHGKYYYRGVGERGGTSLHYLWLVRLKLFPFPHQLGSLVEDPSVCGYSAWLRNAFYPLLFFYYDAEWASIKGALKAMFWIRKTPFIKVVLSPPTPPSVCVCMCVRAHNLK